MFNTKTFKCLSSLPLSFYRYVLESEITFTAEKHLIPGPVAKFLDMPQSPLFTLNLNTPESWMVESVRASYDLDNIYLEEVNILICIQVLEKDRNIPFGK